MADNELSKDVLSDLLTQEAADRIRRQEEKLALFGEHYGHTKSDMVRLIMEDARSRDTIKPPYSMGHRSTGVKPGEVSYVGGRKSGKTFSALNALTQGQAADAMRVYNSAGDIVYTLRDPQITVDGDPLDTVKFDMSYLNTPAYTTSPPQFTDTAIYEQYRQHFTYDIKTTIDPKIYKDMFKAYMGFAQQAKPRVDATQEPQQAEEPEYVGENPCTRVFVYSERRNRMYKDTMIFWLTNPFKDDILACAETNS